MRALLAGCLLMSMAAAAEEPGYLLGTNPPSQPPSPKKREMVGADTHAVLVSEFARARGLNEYEIATLSVQRISCGRRVFSPMGWQVQGDADLKVTDVSTGLIAAEFPSHFSFMSFGAFNPYGNSIADVDTISSLVLLNVRNWRDGRSLRIKKYLSVSFTDENRPAQTVPALDEIKVIKDSNPTTFIVRETIYLENSTLPVYFLCQ